MKKFGLTEPTSQADTKAPLQTFSEEELKDLFAPGAVHVEGTIPVEAAKALEELKQKEMETKLKIEAEEAAKAMTENIEKFNRALNNTFAEVMNGYVPVRKED